ncbi:MULTISPECIES: AraC family transcriptional regulator [unclassified Halomonas]|uniref:helix-turn-helix transcriptional regulator n=1 Tax=unclassified Halomonas TaxID=2609666 RepID=UPI0007D9BAF0|nr:MULTISPECIES: AraC family transcriptional regulator [unclassified Halomonas]MBT2788101.1 helix-turn-helix transcriptional regulator [Halomonas sp. ISL-106]MBT2795850.1 helix-turn-helix transcriptional regulator [Halomonas sp. ISL-104]OAL61359.1 AraC family transcriptional regulator [Halomonas sp. ALS9]
MFNAMTRAEIWLQDTLDKPLGIEDLANHIGYSSSQVRRQFRQSFHISPSAYREKRRLERAAALLALTPLNIAQIAIRCGYQNHSSFSRAFQRQYRLSPRNFRRSLKATLHSPTPNYGFNTRIEKSNGRQMILMRLYKAPEHIKGLGDASFHNPQLACLQARLRLSTTIIALPDILADRVNAINNESFHSYRTDIGLYLADTDNAKDIALPVLYRRVDIPTHYYASTCFESLADLYGALTHTIMYLLNRQYACHVSGHPPQVLWKTNHLELRIPLISG